MSAPSTLGNGRRVDTKMIKTLGNTLDQALLPGELVAVRRRRVLSRRGRCVVRVRVMGGASIGWLDALMLWGASVEVFVCQGGNVKHLVESLYPDVYIAPLAEAAEMPPHRGWDGILFATLDNEEASQHATTLVERWRPSAIVLANGGLWVQESLALTAFTPIPAAGKYIPLASCVLKTKRPL